MHPSPDPAVQSAEMISRFRARPDQGSIAAAAAASIERCKTVRHLKAAHGYMVRNGLTQFNPLISKLIETSSLKIPGQMSYAHQIFSTAQKAANLFMWNTIIRGYSLAGDDQSIKKAISLFKDMGLSGISSNSYTLGFVLNACCKLGSIEEGRLVHALIVKQGLQCETPAVNGLVSLYVTCGCLGLGRQVFDEMPERDVASWSIVISGYWKEGNAVETLRLFEEMVKDGVQLDGFTMATVLGACGDLSALNLGRWVHSYIRRMKIKSDVVLETSLVTMYSKCGSIDEALHVFEGMSEKDLTAWSTMIGGYAIHGYARKAIELFDYMKRAKVRPNSVTFTSVLSACSHAGLVDEGVYQFESMSRDYNINPQIEHYGCMVDLFCRAGLVNRAYKFILDMPLKPNVVQWRALLSACKTHSHKALSERLSKMVLDLEPGSAENYVLVSNMYASLGRWSSVSQIRSVMKDKSAKKACGWSSIEVNGMVHQFVMGDKSHPESRSIYAKLDEIARTLKQKGHVSLTLDVLHDIDEEEKEQVLGVHSERLAIAYGLLHVANYMPIRIVKNLRVCKDCHSVLKLVSMIYQRDIIVRDRIRFHHFREGECSCNDYW